MAHGSTTTVETDEPPRGPERHREVLAISIIVVVFAFLLVVLPDQRVAFRGLEGYPLPPTCRSREWFGIDCPGCGLTRSIVHLAHADWHSSLRVHRLGWFMLAVIVFQIPYRALALRRANRTLFSPRTEIVLSLCIIALLIGNWVYNILTSTIRENTGQALDRGRVERLTCSWSQAPAGATPVILPQLPRSS